ILVLILNVLVLVLRTLTMALHIPQDCIVSFDIAFEVHLRHSLCLRNGSLVNRSLIYLRSMELALIERRCVEIRLVEISTSVLIKIISPIKIVLIILMGRKIRRSDLVSNHLRSETGVSLIVIFGSCLRHILLNVVSISIFVGSGTILVCVGTTASYTVWLYCFDWSRSGRWSWSWGLVLFKSNALTMSLSSATSDEMAGVDELVPTLATTALARV
nr:hypothetical protein [Tanacetum cinerariifolium]